MPMVRFGVNPFGENLYRVVFAPSRYSLAGGTYRPTYRSLGAVWVLERWYTGEEFAKCSKARWDMEYIDLLGPWPARGEYFHAHTFSLSPSDANIEKLIMWIEESRKRRPVENRIACRQEYEAEERTSDANMSDLIRDALPAYGIRPMVGAHVRRGTKTPPIVLSADQTGLPIPGGPGQSKFLGMRRKRNYAR